MKKFKFRKSISDKIIYIDLNGEFKREDGLRYIDEYKDITYNINPLEYTLKFNCTNLKASTNDSLEILKTCFKMYYQSKFKKVIALLTEKQHTVLVQFHILAKKTKLKLYYITVLSFNIFKLYKPHTTQFALMKLYITTNISMITYSLSNILLDKLCRIPFFKDYALMRT